MRPVSFDDEPLYLVDPQDQVVGYADKASCHDGAGKLHRAFSVFLFDDQGRVLLQQRGKDKRLWPGYWSNSCCSHPRRGESISQAARRRVREELGLEPELRELYKFEYRASFGPAGSEHELCSVLIGHADGAVTPHPDEIAAWKFVAPHELDVVVGADDCTPWLKLEWARLRREFRSEMDALRRHRS